MRLLTILTTAALSLAPMATAHPHIFVNTQLTVIYDGDVPTAVQVDWIYDDFFSLLITSDLGIDLDGDLVLTPEEEEILNAAITEWPADFDGDLVVAQDGAPLTLAPKTDHVMVFEDGLVRETHVRPLPDATDAPLSLQAYDPYYYVAYDLIDPVKVTGRDDCVTAIARADLDAARALVQELIGRDAADVGPDEEFPRVGAEFADTVSVTCGAQG